VEVLELGAGQVRHGAEIYSVAFRA
jgi:hypothetical protein